MASSELELTIVALVSNFYRFAEEKAKDRLMTKEEFLKMENQQLQHVLTNSQNMEAFDALIQRLNTAVHKDGKISFQDYWSLIECSRPLLAISKLEADIKRLEENFYTYAKKNGKDNMMEKEEFCKMVTEQLQNTDNNEAADKLIQSLKGDKDKISIDNYRALIGEIARRLSIQMALQHE